MSIETKEKISKSLNGYRHTDETKEKISAARKNRIGVKHPQKIVICPFCGKEGKKNAMNRWHFNNCKYKEAPLTWSGDKARLKPDEARFDFEGVHNNSSIELSYFILLFIKYKNTQFVFISIIFGVCRDRRYCHRAVNATLRLEVQFHPCPTVMLS